MSIHDFAASQRSECTLQKEGQSGAPGVPNIEEAIARSAPVPAEMPPTHNLKKETVLPGVPERSPELPDDAATARALSMQRAGPLNPLTKIALEKKYQARKAPPEGLPPVLQDIRQVWYGPQASPADGSPTDGPLSLNGVYKVMVPEGAVAGELIHVVVDMKPFNVVVPNNAVPGTWLEFDTDTDESAGEPEVRASETREIVGRPLVTTRV